MISLAIFVLLLFLYSLVSRRLEQTVVTAPIVFTVAGMLMFPALQGILKPGINSTIFLGIAEVGLVMLLFTDASRTDLNVLRSIRNLPARLLSTGLLLTIVLGAVVARLVFPQLSIWEAGILGAILAPTDAGLGQIIVNSPRVPMRIRQALNVEAGLNDGLSVPFLLFFIALAVARIAGSRHAPATVHPGTVGDWRAGRRRRSASPADGCWASRAAGSGWRNRSSRSAWSRCRCSAWWRPRCLGASMFIAAFVAGLAVQIGFKEAGKHSVEFAEEWGQLLNLSVFFLFGLVVVRNWPTVQPGGVAVCGPQPDGGADAAGGDRAHRHAPERGQRDFHGLVRPARAGVHRPRAGVSGAGNAFARRIQPSGLAVIVTVMLSIFAHGLSAVPGINLYARKIASLGADAPEHQEVGA